MPSVPLLDLSQYLLDCLGLQQLKSKINYTPASDKISDHREPREFKSFIIRFSTRDIALQVLDKKKEHGKIVSADLVPNGSITEVIFEMQLR